MQGFDFHGVTLTTGSVLGHGFLFYDSAAACEFVRIMGRTYVFYCPRCEYVARVSGGADAGFHCATQTIVCTDCRALYDVPTKLRVAEESPTARPRPKKSLLAEVKPPLPSPVDPTNMLLFSEPPRTKWIQIKPRCPVAALHRVEDWTNPGKCPRCGTFLDRTVSPFRVWD
jgi:hypothetical protein